MNNQLDQTESPDPTLEEIDAAVFVGMFLLKPTCVLCGETSPPGHCGINNAVQAAYGPGYEYIPAESSVRRVPALRPEVAAQVEACLSDGGDDA